MGPFPLFSAESSPIVYWSLNTALVHLSQVSLCGHFSQPPTDYSLHVSWNNMDSSFSSACLACTERLRIIIHHRDKSLPFCYSQNTFHCQSLAYLTVRPDGWFTPLLFLQRCRSLVLTLSLCRLPSVHFEKCSTKKIRTNSSIQVILEVCIWKMWLFTVFLFIAWVSCVVPFHHYTMFIK